MINIHYDPFEEPGNGYIHLVESRPGTHNLPTPSQGQRTLREEVLPNDIRVIGGVASPKFESVLLRVFDAEVCTCQLTSFPALTSALKLDAAPVIVDLYEAPLSSRVALAELEPRADHGEAEPRVQELEAERSRLPGCIPGPRARTDVLVLLGNAEVSEGRQRSSQANRCAVVEVVRGGREETRITAAGPFDVRALGGDGAGDADESKIREHDGSVS